MDLDRTGAFMSRVRLQWLHVWFVSVCICNYSQPNFFLIVKSVQATCVLFLEDLYVVALHRNFITPGLIVEFLFG